MRGDTVESRQDRAVLAQDAGLGKVSFVSVLAGTLVAYGAFAVLLALTAAVVTAVGVDTDFSDNEWRRLGAVGGGVVAVVQFLAYLFGGYVAGRMSRRAGTTNGFLVFVLGILLAVGVAGLVNLFTDGDEIARDLRAIGVPTTFDEWRDIGTVAGIGSLVGMLLGALLGGAAGERWHGKLLTRALDPSVGAGTHATTAGVASLSTHDEGTTVMNRSERRSDVDDNERRERDEHKERTEH